MGIIYCVNICTCTYIRKCMYCLYSIHPYMFMWNLHAWMLACPAWPSNLSAVDSSIADVNTSLVRLIYEKPKETHWSKKETAMKEWLVSDSRCARQVGVTNCRRQRTATSLRRVVVTHQWQVSMQGAWQVRQVFLLLLLMKKSNWPRLYM